MSSIAGKQRVARPFNRMEGWGSSRWVSILLSRTGIRRENQKIQRPNRYEAESYIASSTELTRKCL